MSTYWVYKHEGTIQCNDDIKPIDISTHRAELDTFIGADNIVSEKKDAILVGAACGLPTGRINAFEITNDGWLLLSNGISSGSHGFLRLHHNFSSQKLDVARTVVQTLTSVTCCPPINIRDLVGRPLRTYREGDALTEDYIPERVNIMIEDYQGRETIRDIWFG